MIKNNQYLNEYNKAIEKINSLNKLNPISLNQVDFNHIDNQKSLLNGVIYSLKDNICTKNITTTGGSLFLNDYKPPYDATLKQLLDQAGCICVSKDNLDEFGLGGTGTFSAYGLVHNMYDSSRISGGSSSGSALMVANKVVRFAISSDTGDSTRKPASFNGVVGFKPSYGAISRYGVYPYAPSLDHLGILANNVDDIAMVADVVCQHDNKDYTSISFNHQFYDNLNQLKNLDNIKLVLLKDAYKYMYENERKQFDKYLNFLKQKGVKFDEIDFNEQLLKLIDPIYKAISYAEAVSTYNNFTGILFGNSIDDGLNFEDIMVKNRTKYFGRQLKRRFIIGANITSLENFENVFLKAKKIRTLIIQRVKEIFKEYDAIILPGASSVAHLIEDVQNNEIQQEICADALQIANFAGLPSITIRATKYQNLPIGLNITTNYLKDELALQIAKYLENLGEYHD